MSGETGAVSSVGYRLRRLQARLQMNNAEMYETQKKVE